jgi:hypothetical protein
MVLFNPVFNFWQRFPIQKQRKRLIVVKTETRFVIFFFVFYKFLLRGGHIRSRVCGKVVQVYAENLRLFCVAGVLVFAEDQEFVAFVFIRAEEKDHLQTSHPVFFY